jgi:toxin ParE1/3/4
VKKPRQVGWSRRAENDLYGISDYIAQNNPEAADAFVDYVEAVVADLAVSPIGRRGELEGSTEKVLANYPNYLIIYKYDDSHIHIVRVFHVKQGSKK